MTEAADRALLDDCLSDLVRADFDPLCLHADPLSIGDAALRLVRAELARGLAAVSHPLGFGRIPLSNWDLSAPRIAVHVWGGGTLRELSDDVHDHCYDFVSICHVGGLEHRIFQLSADAVVGEPVAPMSYPAGSCTIASPQVEKAEPAGLIMVEEFKVQGGEIYGLGHEILHSAKPSNELTMTLQFQSPCRKTNARVFRRPGPRPATGGSSNELAKWINALAGTG